MPMPILAHGFDYDDFTGKSDFRGKDGQRVSRYGGEKIEKELKEGEEPKPELYSKFGVNRKFAKNQAERKLIMANMAGFGDAIAGGGEDPIEKACWMYEGGPPGSVHLAQQD